MSFVLKYIILLIHRVLFRRTGEGRRQPRRRFEPAFEGGYARATLGSARRPKRGAAATEEGAREEAPVLGGAAAAPPCVGTPTAPARATEPP